MRAAVTNVVIISSAIERPGKNGPAAMRSAPQITNRIRDFRSVPKPLRKSAKKAAEEQHDRGEDEGADRAGRVIVDLPRCVRIDGERERDRGNHQHDDGAFHDLFLWSAPTTSISVSIVSSNTLVFSE